MDDSDYSMASQLLNMRGLDEEWAEWLCGELANGGELEELLDVLEMLEEQGADASAMEGLVIL